MFFFFYVFIFLFFFCFKAEDGIRDLVRSRGLGDVYKRQQWLRRARRRGERYELVILDPPSFGTRGKRATFDVCLLYTSDAADERSSVDLGGRRILKKKKTIKINTKTTIQR